MEYPYVRLAHDCALPPTTGRLIKRSEAKVPEVRECVQCEWR